MAQGARAWKAFLHQHDLGQKSFGICAWKGDPAWLPVHAEAPYLRVSFGTHCILGEHHLYICKPCMKFNLHWSLRIQKSIDFTAMLLAVEEYVSCWGETDTSIGEKYVSLSLSFSI